MGGRDVGGSSGEKAERMLRPKRDESSVLSAWCRQAGDGTREAGSQHKLNYFKVVMCWPRFGCREDLLWDLGLQPASRLTEVAQPSWATGEMTRCWKGGRWLRKGWRQ